MFLKLMLVIWPTSENFGIDSGLGPGLHETVTNLLAGVAGKTGADLFSTENRRKPGQVPKTGTDLFFRKQEVG